MSPRLALPPLSLYVHLPWCLRKCPYCDFNSHAVASGAAIPEADYIEALMRDLEAEAPWAQGRKLHSIFFGGGTPSLFSAKGIARILQKAQALIGFDTAIEITLEANPGAVEQERFHGYRSAGINRLSLGIQSLNPRHLQALGRIHNTADAVAAIEAARRAGFDNLNLDLMHGLPQQNIAEAMTDLDGVIAWGPEHISWYQLTIEPNTAFYRQPPALPDDDALAEIEAEGFARLAKAGYTRYEISAFCRTARQSRHNRNYWEFGDYLGIGAGAHGKITDAETGVVTRRQKTRLPAHYLSALQPAPPWQTVAAENLPLEFMLNALRLVDGVPARCFSERTGLPLASIGARLKDLRQRGLLADAPERLVTTELGRRFLNDVVATFMSADSSDTRGLRKDDLAP